jgi:hypothetical protein
MLSSKSLLFGPGSRRLPRDAIGDNFDARSREGRFLRRAESDLCAQLNREPTLAELVLIRRAARLMLAVEQLDTRHVGADIALPSNLAAVGNVSDALLAVLGHLGLRAPIRAGARRR